MAATKSRSRRQTNTADREEKRAARVADLKDKFDASVSDLVNSDSWAQMLNGAMKLRRYSFRNFMLILQQCPHASEVAGVREWNRRGRRVRAGEKAIWILAPMKSRNTENADAPSPQGSSEGDDAERQRVFFRPTYVFDISQTEPLEGQADAAVTGAKLTGDAPALMWERLAEYAVSLGYSVERGDTSPADGWTRPSTRTVRVADRFDAAHAAHVLGHEVAHIVCDHVADFEEYRQHRGRMETEAESIAYIVAGALGLDSEAVAVPYVASWAGKTPEAVRDTIKETAMVVYAGARVILDAIEPTDAPDSDTE